MVHVLRENERKNGTKFFTLRETRKLWIENEDDGEDLTTMDVKIE